MNIAGKIKKFKSYLQKGGFKGALLKTIDYIRFLYRIRFNKESKRSYEMQWIKEKFKIICHNNGIQIYWDEKELTSGVGLNAIVRSSGLETDSTKAVWKLAWRTPDTVVFRCIFNELPLSFLWSFEVTRENKIILNVDMELEEALQVDERRILLFVSRFYQQWINSYEEGVLPNADMLKRWCTMPFNNDQSQAVGVRFSQDRGVLPALLLEFDRLNYDMIKPLIYSVGFTIKAHALGVRIIDGKEKQFYQQGKYPCFCGFISLYEEGALLDNKIEGFRKERKQYYEAFRREHLVTSSKGGGKRKKVLLVNLPWERNQTSGVRAGSRWPHIKDHSEGSYLPFPFFLAYATSLLKKYDIEATLIDAIAEELTEKAFFKKLSKLEFDILVAETSIPSFYDDLKLLKEIAQPGVSIVLCGPHSEIYNPKFLDEQAFIDYVLCGEYEFTLLELVESLISNIDLSEVNGLMYRDEAAVVKNKPREPFDIDLLPWPHRDEFIMQKYWDLPGNIPHPSAQMVASRGCPFGCTFCLWPQVMFGGRTYRVREVKDVVDEMEHLVREEHFKSIYFDDDTFNVGKERMLEFCREVKRRGLDDTPWAIMAKADLMDKETLDAMKAAGLYSVKYGVESASQELIDRCQKGLDLKKAKEMILYTKSLGIKVHLTFTFGLPGETKKSISDTIQLALKLDPLSVQFSILTPFYGTELFHELDRAGKIITKDWSLYDGHYNCVFKPDNVTVDELEDAKQRAYALWGEHLRRRRGMRGDMERFLEHIRDHGVKSTVKKTGKYLHYVISGRKRLQRFR